MNGTEGSSQCELSAIWDRCFAAAQRLARDATGVEPTTDALTEYDVFETEYQLTDDSSV